MNRLPQAPAPAQNNGRAQERAQDQGTLSDVRETEPKRKPPVELREDSFFHPEQALILRQSPVWARGIAMAIVGVTIAAVTWANIATIEQVIPATGQLKPKDTVKDVQAPVNGVVKQVLVKDNAEVKKGQTLVVMDSDTTEADLVAARQIKRRVEQENAFYRALLQNGLTGTDLESAIQQLRLPWEVVALANNRVSLQEENRVFQAQLGTKEDGALNLDQAARLKSSQFELQSRMTAASLEIDQLQKQLAQTQVQLASAQAQLIDDRKILADLQNRNRKAIAEAQQSLKIEQRILGSVTPLLEEGALAKLQVEKQQQAVNDRNQRLIEQQVNSAVEVDKQRQQIQTREAEIQRLQKEQQRVNHLIDQAQARMVNTSAVTEKEVYDRIAENNKRLAEIDSQLTKIIVENDKRINELNSQISRAQVTLKYQEIKAPVDGVVFDMKATPGYVTPPNQTEPLLKIVPKDYLVAEVYVTNKDIGFVREGMPAEVRIDSFPYSEFGDIKGSVESVGSDALPPDQINQFYRFPLKITLGSQQLKTQNRTIPLQSGMSVTANIKVREKRTVMSLFTELFTKKLESLETVR
ncbi:MAG: HlyD family efflux transporter periplasmic adaptor subunit [Cyanobacteria bacterium RI_101]|nr:HlyD family efflux transporter periplasmic adaptor subunit [Cyanobacteria bacterium RI_101]